MSIPPCGRGVWRLWRRRLAREPCLLEQPEAEALLVAQRTPVLVLAERCDVFGRVHLGRARVWVVCVVGRVVRMVRERRRRGMVRSVGVCGRDVRPDGRRLWRADRLVAVAAAARRERLHGPVLGRVRRLHRRRLRRLWM